MLNCLTVVFQSCKGCSPNVSHYNCVKMMDMLYDVVFCSARASCWVIYCTNKCESSFRHLGSSSVLIKCLVVVHAIQSGDVRIDWLKTNNFQTLDYDSRHLFLLYFYSKNVICCRLKNGKICVNSIEMSSHSSYIYSYCNVSVPTATLSSDWRA